MLSKGLNFALPSTSLEYSEYLVDYELFFRDTLSLEISHLDCELLKSRLKNLLFSSFKTYNSSRKPNNLTPEEFESPLKFRKNKTVVIQKSDKGNSVVLIDKVVYSNDIKNLLDSPREFEKLNIDPNKELNFILNCEEKSLTLLRKLKIKMRLMRTYIINYAQLVVNLESFMILKKFIKRLLIAALLFEQFFQSLGYPRIR